MPWQLKISMSRDIERKVLKPILKSNRLVRTNKPQLFLGILKIVFTIFGVKVKIIKITWILKLITYWVVSTDAFLFLFYAFSYSGVCTWLYDHNAMDLLVLRCVNTTVLGWKKQIMWRNMQKSCNRKIRGIFRFFYFTSFFRVFIQ